LEEELNHFPMPWPCSIIERFQISLGQRTKPAPTPAKHLIAASHDLRDGSLPGKEGPGQCTDKQRIWQNRRQQSAPTSPAMRERVCVGAQ